MDDYGSNLFSIENIQRIAQFDIRTLNMDRNAGNLLVIYSLSHEKEMIPIDHSYILPESLHGAHFDWVYWRQAEKPVEPIVAQYIKNIDVDSEILLLEKLGVNVKAIENFKIASLFLKRACAVNWNFKMMADYVCRNGKEKSLLEDLVENVKGKSTDQLSFWFHFNKILNDSIIEHE